MSESRPSASARPEAWRCSACRKEFPDERGLFQADGDTLVRCCPLCGARCEPAEATGEAGRKPRRSFLDELSRSVVYPFQGDGKYILIGGPVVFGAGAFYTWFFARFFSCVAPVLLLLVAVATFCFCATYMFSVLAATANGEDEPPDWPTNCFDVGETFLMTGTVLIAMLPAAAWWITQRDLGVDRTFLALVGLGVLYLPMGFTAAALWNTAAGLNPFRVIVSIFKVGPTYLLACVFVALIVALNLLLWRIPLPIPVVGTVLRAAVVLHFLMAEMRVCGLLYRFYEHKLRWFASR